MINAQQLIARRFRVVQQLGAGALGPLFRALDSLRGEEVAVRLITSVRGNDVAVARLGAQVRALGSAEHPGIARLYDCGVDEGQLWLSTQLAHGDSLERRVGRSGALAPLDAAQLAGSIADALAEGHRHGVVHRDLKPRNVFFDGSRVVAHDVGVMAAVLTGPALTALSSPGMIPPEQIALEAMDHRADVYSLGAVLFFAVVGEPPFSGGSAGQLQAAQLGFKPPRPRDKNPKVPEGLELIILRAMARRREDRHQSMRELRDDLSRWAASWRGERE